MELESWFMNEFWPTLPKDLIAGGVRGSRAVAWKEMEKIDPDEKLQDHIMWFLRERMLRDRKRKRQGMKVPKWKQGERLVKYMFWQDELPDTLPTESDPVINKCKCGHDAEIGNECWHCYEGKTNNDHKRDTFLYEHLKSVGLGKRTDETRKEYSQRCREYALSETSLAGVQR